MPAGALGEERSNELRKGLVLLEDLYEPFQPQEQKAETFRLPAASTTGDSQALLPGTSLTWEHEGPGGFRGLRLPGPGQARPSRESSGPGGSHRTGPELDRPTTSNVSLAPRSTVAIAGRQRQRRS